MFLQRLVTQRKVEKTKKQCCTTSNHFIIWNTKHTTFSFFPLQHLTCLFIASTRVYIDECPVKRATIQPLRWFQHVLPIETLPAPSRLFFSHPLNCSPTKYLRLCYLELSGEVPTAVDIVINAATVFWCNWSWLVQNVICRIQFPTSSYVNIVYRKCIIFSFKAM